MTTEREFINPAGSHWLPLGPAPVDAAEIDAEMLADKKANGYQARAEASALAHQIKTQDLGAQS